MHAATRRERSRAISGSYGAVSYGTVGSVRARAGVSSMDRKIPRPTADVIETRPITLAGVETHPGLLALRTLARRITTPLLPDDYLRLANPLWSARELRARGLAGRGGPRASAPWVLKPGWGFSLDYQPGQSTGIGVLGDGRWRWRSYSLSAS